MPDVWVDGDRLIVAHRYGGCYGVVTVGNTGIDADEELSELPAGAVELGPLRAEPVLAPNALDASAQRWLQYAAELEVKNGERLGEIGRLKARLDRIGEAHCKDVDNHGGTTGDCNECGWSWPCPTHVWATTERDALAPWDPRHDEEEPAG